MLLTLSNTILQFIYNRGKTSKTLNDSPEPPIISKGDYERAEQEIFDAIGRLEHGVEKVIESEVEMIFHKLEDHEKSAIVKKASQAVKRGASKVKQEVNGHDHEKERQLPELHSLHHYPYDWPHDDPDHRILHAIEAAEKAVLDAVSDEVKNIFHDIEHHEKRKETEKVLRKSVDKASKNLDDTHEHRRNWIKKEAKDDNTSNLFQEYVKYCQYYNLPY